jgi:hypothetical protein
MNKLVRFMRSMSLAVALCALAAFAAFVDGAAAQSPPPPDPAIKFLAVKLPDNTLSYPSASLPDLSDEHTTIIPTPDGSYLFFSASSLTDRIAGAVVPIARIDPFALVSAIAACADDGSDLRARSRRSPCAAHGRRRRRQLSGRY